MHGDALGHIQPLIGLIEHRDVDRPAPDAEQAGKKAGQCRRKGEAEGENEEGGGIGKSVHTPIEQKGRPLARRFAKASMPFLPSKGVGNGERGDGSRG